MKKYIYILVLFFTCFFMGFDGVEAFDADFTCEYKGGNNTANIRFDYSAKYNVASNVGYRMGDLKGYITLSGKKEKEAKIDSEEKAQMQHFVFAENSCPYALLIRDNKKIFFCNDDTSCQKKAQDGDIWLTRKTDDYNMYEGLIKYHNSEYRLEKYQCESYVEGGVFTICSKYRSEQSIVCDYANDMQLKFRESWYTGDNSSYIFFNNKCPSIVYEIVKDDKKYYKFFGNWPSVCTKSDSTATCFKYSNQTLVEEYGKKNQVEFEEFSKKFEIGRYSTLCNVEGKKGSLLIEGNSNGKITKYDLILGDEKVYFATSDEEEFKKYLKGVAENSGEVRLPIFECGSQDAMKEKSNFPVTIFGKIPEDYSGDLCILKDVAGNSDNNFVKYHDSCVENTGETNDLKEKINKIVINVSNNTFDKDELYENSKDVYDECKKVFNDINVKESDEVYKSCEDFVNNKLSDWASKGYFGDNIISVGDTGCSATLGTLAEWLKKIYNILLLAVPVLIMIFGFKDFIKAILNGKEDELKKAGTTFIKRLIFGAVFVALPMLISLVIGLAFGEGFADICIF